MVSKMIIWDRANEFCESYKSPKFCSERGSGSKIWIFIEEIEIFLFPFLFPQISDCGKDGPEIHNILMDHYGKAAYRKTAVYYWTKEVKRGRTNLTDKEAPGKLLDEDLAAVIQRQHEKALIGVQGGTNQFCLAK
jgi:hypothetical protein